MKEFNKSNYIFIQKEIFNNNDLLAEFHKFLKKEFNEDPLDYLLDLKKLKESKENKIEKAKEIYITYLQDKSKKELNLASDIKLKFKNFFEKKELKEDNISEIFNDIEIQIKKELLLDNYFRFQFF
jgi:hypothetical protein